MPTEGYRGAGEVSVRRSGDSYCDDINDDDVVRSTIMNFNDYQSKISKRNLYFKWNVQIT